MLINEGRDVLENKIKDIDQQIIVLNNLKNQYLTRLRSLPVAALQQQTPIVNKLSSDEKVAFNTLAVYIGSTIPKRISGFMIMWMSDCRCWSECITAGLRHIKCWNMKFKITWKDQ